METRASYAAIGLFILVALMTGLGFLYWLTNAGQRAQQAEIRVVFAGAVTGLNTGSGVLFNGIKIGEVADLSLDEKDPNTVVAMIRVDRTKPIRVDTRAVLSYQGLTGVANLQLEGGSRNAPLLLESVKGGGIPTIQAEVSPFQDILESAKNVLNRADSAMEAIDDFIKENGPAFNRTVNNVETFSKALADNAGAIDDALAGIADAGNAIGGIADDLKGTAKRAEEILNAVDPARVAAIVEEVNRSSERLDKLLARAEEVVGGIDPAKVNGMMDGLAAASKSLNDTIERANAVVAAVDPQAVDRLVTNLDQGVQRVSSAADKADRLLAAVDGEKVQKIVDDVGTATRNIADASGTITGVITSAQATLGKVGEVVGAVDPAKVRSTVDDVSGFAAGLSGYRPAIDGLLADASAAADKADGLLAAVDRDKVRTIVDDVGTATRNIADASGTITGVIASAQSTLGKVGEVVGAVDPAKVRSTVDDVSGFAASLSGYKPEIDGILADVRSATGSLKRLGETVDARNRDVDLTITDARNLVAQLNGIAARTDGILQKVDGYVEGDGQGLIKQATDTLASIRSVAETLNARLGPITDNVAKFTDRGLGSYTQLAEDGRRALQRLDRVLSGIERNPQQFIFGGEGVPEYAPRRR